jgi:hypothetical protein
MIVSCMKRREWLYTSLLLCGALPGCSTLLNQQDTNTENSVTSTNARNTTTNAKGSDSPDFELVSFRAPSRAELGINVTYSITVKNVGEQSGEFETDISKKTTYRGWEQRDESVIAELGPEEEYTFESEEFTYRYLNTIDVKVEAFDEVRSVQFVDRKLPYGESFETPNGFSAKVSNPTFKDTYTWTDDSGTEKDTQPSEGMKYLFFDVSMTNTSEDSVVLPDRTAFSVGMGHNKYDSVSIAEFDSYYTGGETQPNSRSTGKVICEVPESVSLEDVRVIMTDDQNVPGPVSVYWLTSIQ